MTKIQVEIVIIIYYIIFFSGTLVVLTLLATSIIYSINKAAKKYKFLWMIAEYIYYRKSFKEFFKNKRSITEEFNND